MKKNTYEKEIKTDVSDLNDTENSNNEVEQVSESETNIPAEEQKKFRRKRKLNKRAIKKRAYSTIFTVLIIASIVVVNVIVTLISDRIDASADLTGNSVYTLDPKTEDFLKNTLDKDVTVTVLNTEQDFVLDRNFKQVSEILRRMSLVGEHISIDYVNIDRDPNYISRFKDESPDTNYLVVECAQTGRHKLISPSDYFGLTTEEAAYYYYYYGYVAEYLTEQEVISAMLYVTNDSPVRVAFTEGFGETDSAALQNLLAKNGYEVEDVNLLTADVIDPAIDILVVHAPRIDLNNEQLSKIEAFLDNSGKFGKNVFYFGAVTQPQTPNIDSFLADWGLSVGYSDIGQSNDLYMITSITRFAHLVQIQDTDFTASTYGSGLYTIGADMRPVEFTSGTTADTEALVKTFEGAFLYPFDFEGEFDINSAESGIFNVAAVSEKKSDSGASSRVFVFGSDQLSSSYLLSFNNGNNGDLFVNMFNFISGKEEGITITPKAAANVYFEMDAKTANTFAVTLCIVLPVAVIGLGIAVYVRRRHR